MRWLIGSQPWQSSVLTDAERVDADCSEGLSGTMDRLYPGGGLRFLFRHTKPIRRSSTSLTGGRAMFPLGCTWRRATEPAPRRARAVGPEQVNSQGGTFV